MLTEAIILAGGLGTRLKSISGETPKPLVTVSGKPFIYYVMDNLIQQGIQHIVFAVSYHADFFMSKIGNCYKNIKISYSVEDQPLGTGGAIRQALGVCITHDILVTNGDTYLDIALQSFYFSHKSSEKGISMALVNMDDLSRYGSVTLSDGKIIGFYEKGKKGSGIINGGAYLLSTSDIKLPPGPFSFENTILKKQHQEINPFICNGLFIDIGIPDDYFKACKIFAG